MKKTSLKRLYQINKLVGAYVTHVTIHDYMYKVIVDEQVCQLPVNRYYCDHSVLKTQSSANVYVLVPVFLGITQKNCSQFTHLQ